jgi:hypothetical protein
MKSGYSQGKGMNFRNTYRNIPSNRQSPTKRIIRSEGIEGNDERLSRPTNGSETRSTRSNKRRKTCRGELSQGTPARRQRSSIHPGQSRLSAYSALSRHPEEGFGTANTIQSCLCIRG